MWNIPARCCTSLASSVAVPVPLPCLNLCRLSWREMDILRRLFMIVVIILNIASTNPMPLYYPFPFGGIIIVVRASSASTLPSRNISCAILTNTSHLVLSGFLSRVAFMIHIFRCSTYIPEGTPTLTAWILRTTTVISSSLGGPYVTTSGCTSNMMVSPSRALLL